MLSSLDMNILASLIQISRTSGDSSSAMSGRNLSVKDRKLICTSEMNEEV